MSKLTSILLVAVLSACVADNNTPAATTENPQLAPTEEVANTLAAFDETFAGFEGAVETPEQTHEADALPLLPEEQEPADQLTLQNPVSCPNVCSVGISAACYPFALVGSVACAIGSIPLCGYLCKNSRAPRSHCMHHDGSTACVTEVRTWWCDAKVDGHGVFLRYELQNLAQPGIRRTFTAPRKACSNIGWPTRNLIHRWQLCTDRVGCTGWFYPFGH